MPVVAAVPYHINQRGASRQLGFSPRRLPGERDRDGIETPAVLHCEPHNIHQINDLRRCTPIPDARTKTKILSEKWSGDTSENGVVRKESPR